MSRWKSESAYLGRYAGSGALNTVAGFAVIFALTGLSFSPYLANVGGYLTGFVLGFVVSRKFVFRSNGHFVAESVRYLLAFLCCFALNLAALKFALDWLQMAALLAQLFAAVVYTGAMYALTRWFVFAAGIKAHSPE
ncbi:MAG: GtrA family protein [Gallionella sp.]|nr:GtrA family protein [Gallionella sp.]MDD4945457.1 GtrA family protein [Gallionella sp.]MDD5612391.1 GtrA family protein [Gallionella sp.]